MQTSPRLELQNTLVVYPQLLSMGKKQLWLGIPVELLFTIACSYMVVRGENILIALGGALFFAFIFFSSITQLTWGPFLIVNEQEIRVRPNPFLPSMLLYWDELASMTPFMGARYLYLDIALAPAHLEAFLQRQSPLTKKILANKLRRTHLIAHFPFLLLPSAISTLLEAIQKRYSAQIRQHHIIIEKQLGFKKRSSREKR